MKNFYRSIVLASSLGVAMNAGAQTNPVPAVLADENYEFLSWSAAAEAETYPANMIFHRSDQVMPLLITTDLAGDWHCGYDLTSRPRINGLGEDGISFINTGSAQRDNCVSGATDMNIFMGGALLAVNTEAVTSAHIEFDTQVLSLGDGAVSREYALRLQYRIGTSGAFTDFDIPVEFSTVGRAAEEEESYSIELPASLLDQEVVQFRWLYYDVNIEGAGGSRPSLRLDNIRVINDEIEAGDPPVLTSTEVSLSGFMAAVGEESMTRSFVLSGSFLVSDVTLSATESYVISTEESGSYSSSLILIPGDGILDETTIYVRFEPASAGAISGTVEAVSGSAMTTISVSGTAYESSNPDPIVISGDDFAFTAWASDEVSGTFPLHMAFQTTTESSPSITSAPLVRDWHCGYDLESRPRFTGLGDDGIAFLNTGSAQYDNCADGTNAMNVYIGGVVLGLNTIDVDSARLDYDVQLLTVGDGSTPRQYGVRLQYRTGLNAEFTDFEIPVEFVSEGKEAGASEHVSFNLPEDLLEKADVQLRWLYYDLKVEGSGGTRPQFRLDNITVTNLEESTGLVRIESGDVISIYPNPVQAGEQINFTEALSGRLIDYAGRVVLSFDNATSISTTGLSSGLYMIVTAHGNSKVIVK